MNHSTFRHEAMATYFEILVAGKDDGYARRAAAAAFRELERLEAELSRFVESSDISRLNRLRQGESAVVGDDAFECLVLAAGVTEATLRAFDPAYASEFGPDHPEDAPAFTLDPDSHAVTSRIPRLRIDLGAVGKGYALDRMAEVLAEWDTTCACLNSGGSTALALDGPPGSRGWPVGLGEDGEREGVMLARSALSGSGIAVKGSHLVDPRTSRPASRTSRAWAMAPVAAVSDALSTAFFVMTDKEVESFCSVNDGVGAAIMMPDGMMRRHGTLSGAKAP